MSWRSSQMPENLWGDLSNFEIVRTPKAILKEQADLLTQATSGVLEGAVNEEESSIKDFRYDLDIRVPTLNRYIYTVLSVHHDLELYPARVRSSSPRVDQECDDEPKFAEVIGFILSSKEIRHILSRLISQSK